MVCHVHVEFPADSFNQGVADLKTFRHGIGEHADDLIGFERPKLGVDVECRGSAPAMPDQGIGWLHAKKGEDGIPLFVQGGHGRACGQAFLGNVLVGLLRLGFDLP